MVEDEKSSHLSPIDPVLLAREGKGKPEEESGHGIAWCSMHDCRPDACSDRHDPVLVHLAWALDNLQAVLGVAARLGIKIVARHDGRSRGTRPPYDVLAQGMAGVVQPVATIDIGSRPGSMAGDSVDDALARAYRNEQAMRNGPRDRRHDAGDVL